MTQKPAHKILVEDKQTRTIHERDRQTDRHIREVTQKRAHKKKIKIKKEKEKEIRKQNLQ